MTKLSRLACGLLVVAACGGKSDSPAPKPVDEPAKPIVKADPKPAPTPTPAPEPPAAPPAAGRKASEADQKLVADIDDWMKFTFKPAQDTFIDMEVKPRVKDGKTVVDVLAAGKVIDTIESGVAKDDFQMEVKSKISAMKEGVMAVVSATKTTGKPADYYMARVYTWNGSKLVPGRKIEFDQVYDPAKDGL